MINVILALSAAPLPVQIAACAPVAAGICAAAELSARAGARAARAALAALASRMRRP